MFDLEVRTFEQRFGDRCFCGESWGSPKRCGERVVEDWTIQQSLKMLFSDRTAECDFCGKPMSVSSYRKHCFDCAKLRRRALNGNNVRAYRERHQISKVCRCGNYFTTYKRDQRYCSLSCGNRYRSKNR